MGINRRNDCVDNKPTVLIYVTIWSAYIMLMNNTYDRIDAVFRFFFTKRKDEMLSR